MFWLLFNLSWAANCPNYECDRDLASGVCIRFVAGKNYLVNDSICPSGTYCSYANVQNWSITHKEGDEYICRVTDDIVLEDPTDINMRNCGSREEDKDLASGSHPKECEDVSTESTDCLLKDGTYSPCVCGINAKAYCVPDKSS